MGSRQPRAGLLQTLAGKLALKRKKKKKALILETTNFDGVKTPTVADHKLPTTDLTFPNI